MNLSKEKSLMFYCDSMRNLNKIISVKLPKTCSHRYRRFKIQRYKLSDDCYENIKSYVKKYHNPIKYFKDQTYIPNKLKFASKPRSSLIINQINSKSKRIKLLDLFNRITGCIIIHVACGRMHIHSYKNKNRDLNYYMIKNHSYKIYTETLDHTTYFRLDKGYTLAFFEHFDHLEYINPTIKIPFIVKLKNNLLFLDCEMGKLITNNQCLTSISLLNENGDKILTTLVNPVNQVKSYVNFITGITEKKLIGKLDELKTLMTVRKLIESSILVGCDLRNDMKVLKIEDFPRNRIIDLSTSPYIKYQMNTKDQFIALKRMALHFLNQTIQNDHHTAYQDTKTILNIFKLNKEELMNELHNP